MLVNIKKEIRLILSVICDNIENMRDVYYSTNIKDNTKKKVLGNNITMN